MKALLNGKIYLSGDRFAQALLFDERVILAGTNDEILSVAPAGCKRIDLGGRLVLPGFIDSHIHLLGMGYAMCSLDLNNANSIDDLIAQSKAYMKDHTCDNVLIGRGWNHDYFTDGRLPNKYDLDKISIDIPIMLTRVCGHIAVVNSKALEVLGITESTSVPEGGSVSKSSNGELSGIICENALALLNPLNNMEESEAPDKVLKVAFRHAAKHGVTSVHTNDISAGCASDVYSAYDAIAHNERSLRVYHQCLFENSKDIEKFCNNGFAFGMGDDFNRIGPIKMLSDGSLGARTAYLRAPYNDMPSTSGIACFSKEAHMDMVLTAVKHGFSTVTHAIGDAAFEMCLNSIESVSNADNNAKRHGIVHCQITSPEQIARMAKLNIVAYTQPIFLHYDLHIADARVGESLAGTSYAFKTMLDQGIVETFGTDSPVEHIDPINGIYCAVNRKDLNGCPAQGWYSNECMSVSQAVDCYTRNGAYASFEEKSKGKLLNGYVADFVILDKDIFTCDKLEIKSAGIIETYVGGERVYEK